MAPRFWVGGTGTWDASTATNWSATSGGAGGASVPGSADDVTFDGLSGGGTVTVNFGGLITLLSLTMSAFTGTLDFATNNNNITLTGASPFTSSGSGTRTLNMGNGTWTLSSATASWSINSATNFTFNANGSTLAFTGNGTRRFFSGTTRTYNVVSLSGGSSASLLVTGTSPSPTITTLTIAPQNRFIVTSGVTVIATTMTNIAASASTPVLIGNDNPVNGVGTISSANNFTGDYCGISGITFSGGGTFAATNSYNFGANSGITITGPSVGGGAVGVIGG